VRLWYSTCNFQRQCYGRSCNRHLQGRAAAASTAMSVARNACVTLRDLSAHMFGIPSLQTISHSTSVPYRTWSPDQQELVLMNWLPVSPGSRVFIHNAITGLYSIFMIICIISYSLKGKINIKICLCSVKHYTIKTYVGVEV
jgi:hypothetical protein